MTPTVGDFIRIMEGVAPAALAEKWDNVGLQIGQKDWPVRNIWVALDPLPEVVNAACRENADLLITHHPLIFKPLKSIAWDESLGQIILQAAQSRLAVFSAHTNLDIAPGGLNDIFAQRLGLTDLRPLAPVGGETPIKIVILAPSRHEKKLVETLAETATEEIVVYSNLSFRRVDHLASSGGGSRHRKSDGQAVRIETLVDERNLSGLAERLRTRHSRDTLACDFYSVVRTGMSEKGMGRTGNLSSPTDLKSLASMAKRTFGAKAVKVAGDPNLPVSKVAVCTGSGGGLMARFLASPADVYISGDLRYHDARDAQAAGKGLIDVGHFASEHIVVAALAEKLRNAAAESGLKVSVHAWNLEEEPFVLI